jgi:GTP-binding protein
MRIPVLAIVGRPNVGKSTLFNRIVGKRLAIVEDTPGVTRDRHYAHVENYYSIPFSVVDTGGITGEDDDQISQAVREQSLVAIEEADIIITLFDGREGLLAGDEEVVEILRPRSKDVLYVVNKCDGAEQLSRVNDFYSLGLEEFHDISALHGRNVRALIEKALQNLPDYQELFAAHNRDTEISEQAILEAELEFDKTNSEPIFEDKTEQEEDSYLNNEEEIEEEEEDAIEVEPDFAPVFIPADEDDDEAQYDKIYKTRSLNDTPREHFQNTPEEDDEIAALDDDTEQRHEIEEIECIRFSIIGRPNVGKSTLLNTLIGEQRAITSPIAGTTRDALQVEMTKNDQKFMIVDTAGLRRKGKIEESSIERYSVLRAISAISESDVAILVIDAVEGPTEQDAKILGLAHEQGRGIVIAVNKWEMIEKDHRTVHAFKDRIKEIFKFAPYAEPAFISAKSGKGCPQLFGIVKKIAYSSKRRVKTRILNEVLKKRLRQVIPPSYRGRPIKFSYAVQIGSTPPRFALFFNYPQKAHFSYLRLIRNTIIKEFNFIGTDVKFALKKRE